jgi:hypothetical protein
MKRAAINRADVVYWALWIAVVTLYLVWPLTHLEAYAWSNDEGLYVQRAALANAGYPLYTETFHNKPPLLIWILQLAFRVAGPTLAVARLTSLCLSLVGFVALGGLVGRLWSRWAGLASAAMLLGLPEIPVRAHAVTSDLPAMAFALVTLWAAASFRRSGRRVWMAASGAAFAGALLIHPLLVYTALPLAAILFLPSVDSPARKTGWLDLTVFLSVMVIAGLLVLAAIDRQAARTWILRYNLSTASNAQRTAPSANLSLIVEYLRQRGVLAWLAIVNLIAFCTTPTSRRGLLTLMAWLFATAITLLVWSPIWTHYLLFLALPLAAVTGAALAAWGQHAIEDLRRGQHLTTWHPALTFFLLAGLLVLIVQRSKEAASTLYIAGGPEWSDERLAAQAFLEEAATPDGFVATDDPLLAFTAGQLVPPPLTGTSYKRIDSGYLAAGDVAESILRYEAQVVLFAKGRLERIPSLEQWVAAVATERRDFGYLRAYRLSPLASAPYPAESRLGSGLRLRGHDLSSDELRPGDTFTVTLFWERDGDVPADYHVFVHLADERDQLWSQHDGPPLMGTYPTSQWAEGLLLPDPHTLEVSPETPPGTYRLVVGMYAWPSLERLLASLPDGSRWPDDRILLAELTITAP